MAKINAPLAALAGLGGAAAWFHPSVAGSDLWWHLAAGREIWARRAIPSTDSFSFTFAGEEWLNHEWLWDAVFWGAYSLHPQAAAWLNLALLLTLFALVFALAWRASESLLAAGAATWIAAAGAHWFLDIRPHEVTLLLVATLLLIRDRPWAPWAWPGLVILWANLHAGFVFGVCAIGLDVLLRSVLASLRERRLVLPRREWTGLALCGLALLANPWGPRILEYPLSYLDQGSAYRTLREWLPPALSLDPRGFEGRFWATGLLAAAAVLRLARGSPYLVALAVVTFAMACVSRRFIPLFQVTAAPLTAVSLAWLLARLQQRWPLLRAPAAGLATGSAALAVALLLWSGVRLHPQLLERWTEHDLYPVAAVRYLEALGPPGRVLNLYNWGGYLMLHLPQSRVFIDGRANTVYDEEILSDYVALLNGRPGTRALLARYHADVALVNAGERFGHTLRSGAEPWRRIYVDSVAEILVPPDSPLLRRALPPLEQVVSDAPELRIALARSVARRGDLPRAIRIAEDVVAHDPLYVAAHGELALLHAERKDAEAVERAIDAGLRALPRRAHALYEYAGRAFERAGHLPRALHAYRKTLPAGPFFPARTRREQIERLERLLARPPERDDRRRPG